MKRQDQFEWAVDTLVKAYFEGTLEFYDCKKCAIGNLISANNGFKQSTATWPEVFKLGQPCHGERAYKGDIKKEIEASGYHWRELMRIEEAFMSESLCGNVEAQFNGLMAVLDVLFDIHEVSEDEMPAYRAKFKGHPKLELA